MSAPYGAKDRLVKNLRVVSLSNGLIFDVASLVCRPKGRETDTPSGSRCLKSGHGVPDKHRFARGLPTSCAIGEHIHPVADLGPTLRRQLQPSRDAGQFTAQ